MAQHQNAPSVRPITDADVPTAVDTLARAFAGLGPILGELSGDRAAVSQAADAVMAPHRPKEPGWFLETVATSPEAQGKGLGSAVLIPGIQEAGRAECPAFLETSSEANVRFYERLGFQVTADVQLPTTVPAPGACAGTPAESLRIRPSGTVLRPSRRPRPARPRPGRAAGAERRRPGRRGAKL